MHSRAPYLVWRRAGDLVIWVGRQARVTHVGESPLLVSSMLCVKKMPLVSESRGTSHTNTLVRLHRAMRILEEGIQFVVGQFKLTQWRSS